MDFFIFTKKEQNYTGMSCWPNLNGRIVEVFRLKLYIFFPHVFVGPDQALQPDTEQSGKEEATWRARELLHLVHWSRWCWCWWAWGSHQGRHLAKPFAVLLGMFTTRLIFPCLLRKHFPQTLLTLGRQCLAFPFMYLRFVFVWMSPAHFILLTHCIPIRTGNFQFRLG